MIALVAGALCVAAGGCGIGAKDALAARIDRAADSAWLKGTAAGTISLSLRVTEQTGSTLSGQARAFAIPSQPVALVLGQDRAEVGAAPTTAAVLPVAVFIGSRIYERASQNQVIEALGSRAFGTFFNGPPGVAALAEAAPAPSLSAPGTGRTAAGSTGADNPAPLTAGSAGLAVAGLPGASPDAGGAVAGLDRQWFEFDFASLRSPRTSVLVSGALGLNPVFFVRLLHGTLAGSIRDLGSAAVDGQPSRHFAVNLDPAKVESQLSGDERENLTNQVTANAVPGGAVFPSQVWIGADGLPRRIQVTVPQQLDTGDKDELTVTLDLSSFGTSIGIGTPRAQEVAQMQSFARLVQAASS